MATISLFIQIFSDLFNYLIINFNRYPVIVNRFHLRPNTGGNGKFCGGDGVVREFLFRKNLTLSVLTERRVFRPYGLNGENSFCYTVSNTMPKNTNDYRALN